MVIMLLPVRSPPGQRRMLTVSRRLPGVLTLARSLPRVARLATAKSVDLDEEFPGLPSISPTSASPFKIETATLPSGVKVVSTEGGKATSVGIAVAAGSQYETVSEYGSAHILQQLAFKATSGKSALKVLRDLEAVGSVPSVSAGRDLIVYKVTSLPENAEAALSAAFETVLSPKITPYVINELEESLSGSLAELASNGKLQLIEALYEAAYGENTPLGHSFYGSGDVSPAVLAGFRAKTYVGSGITVVGTGVAHSQLLSWASGLTDSVPKGSPSAAPSTPYLGGESRIKASSDTTFVGLALPAPAKSDAASLAVLTAAWNSVLPAGASSFVLPGLVGVAGAAPSSSAGAYVEGLLKVLKSTGGPFALAKTAAKVSSLSKLDVNAFEVLAEGSLAGIEDVTEASVNSVHGKLWKSGVSMAAVGNLSSVPKLSKLT